MEKIDLLCIPFAGGNRYSYRTYENRNSRLNIVPLECPGRGARLYEPLLTDINQMAEDLYGRVKERIGKDKYAIYGHSMGGLLAYLLTLKVAENSSPPPLHVFVTGTSGPSAASRGSQKLHLLNKEDFIGEIKNMQGCPAEVLENEDLFNFIEPIFRADFLASESYTYSETLPLNIPFTIITGTEERIAQEDILLWKKESNLIDFKKMPGNHFFIFENSADIIKVVVEKLFPNKQIPSYE